MFLDRPANFGGGLVGRWGIPMLAAAAMRILVVEDEPTLRRAYARALGRRGYLVQCATNAASARRHLESPTWDAIMLDRKLPDDDGLALCRELRARGDKTPVLMLTSLMSDDEIIEGLADGADDYLVKPVSVAVLAARLTAVLRRARKTLAVPGIELDVLGRTVRYSVPAPPPSGIRLTPRAEEPASERTREIERRESLSEREARLLAALMEHPGEVVPRERLYSACWGDELGMRWNRLDVVALRLRLKLGPHEDRLETVRGRGLCLRS